MNPKVQAFIDKAKNAKLLSRNKHLIFLGLTDDEKTEKRYLNYFAEGSEFDEEEQLYYEYYPAAVTVTDDEYAEICKYAEMIESNKANVYEAFEANSSEKTLSTIATIVLWIGIIGSVILFITGIILCNSHENELGYSLLFAIIPLLTFYIITWTVLKVLRNISYNLREINQKTK